MIKLICMYKSTDYKSSNNNKKKKLNGIQNRFNV